MDPAVLREDMVDGLEHSLGRPLPEGIGVAMRDVPRHEFVDEAPYDNRPSYVDGTVVLAPATVSRLLTALDPRGGNDVLVVGAGVGYTAGVLAELVGPRHVHAVDISRSMVYEARSNLEAAGYEATLVDCRDGAQGLPEYAPFDRILVEAAVVEPPARLLDQLAPDGRLAFPRGSTDQTLAAVEPTEESPGYRVVDERGPVRFAPLLVDGEQPGVTRNRTVREDREFAQQGYFAKHGWEHEWVDWEDRLSGREHESGGGSGETGRWDGPDW